MRRFYLDRNVDVTGVSGIGCVAAGCLFFDGTVVIRWFGQHPTTTVHASMASVEHIHLHEGRTTIRWRDKVCFFCGATEEHPDQSFCIYCGASGTPVDKKDPSLGTWVKAITIESTPTCDAPNGCATPGECKTARECRHPHLTARPAEPSK